MVPSIGKNVYRHPKKNSLGRVTFTENIYIVNWAKITTFLLRRDSWLYMSHRRQAHTCFTDSCYQPAMLLWLETLTFTWRRSDDDKRVLRSFSVTQLRDYCLFNLAWLQDHKPGAWLSKNLKIVLRSSEVCRKYILSVSEVKKVENA